MVSKETAKKIAQIVLSASTVEEIAFRFAALGLNFPEDPYTRCHILDSYISRKKASHSRIIWKEMLIAIRDNKDPDFPGWRLRQTILGNIAAYAAASVDLTDQQANQIFYDLARGKINVETWKRRALSRYWRKKAKQSWQA